MKTTAKESSVLKFFYHTGMIMNNRSTTLRIPKYNTYISIIRFRSTWTYGLLLLLPVTASLDLYRDGSVGATISGAAEPRPRPGESFPFLLLLLLGVLILGGGAVNVHQVPSRRRLQNDLLARRWDVVARLHGVPRRLLTVLLLYLQPLLVQPVQVVSRLRGAIVHGHGETRHVATPRWWSSLTVPPSFPRIHQTVPRRRTTCSLVCLRNDRSYILHFSFAFVSRDRKPKS